MTKQSSAPSQTTLSIPSRRTIVAGGCVAAFATGAVCPAKGFAGPSTLKSDNNLSQISAVLPAKASPPAASSVAPSTRTGSMETADGHEIPFSYWKSRSEPGCMIVGVHAFGDYSAAFAEMATRLSERGHSVLAFDQRGFGKTPMRGVYASDALYVSDLARMMTEARRIGGRPRPLVVMAESFGASVAILATAQRAIRPDALILSGPGVREDIPAKPIWDRLIENVAFFFGSGSVTIDQDSEDLTDIARARFRSDPLVLRELRADTYESVVAIADQASFAADRVTVPTLVLYGERDGIIDRASIDALMRRLGKRGDLRTYAQAPHLVLQARERRVIDADILQFLSKLG